MKTDRTFNSVESKHNGVFLLYGYIFIIMEWTSTSLKNYTFESIAILLVEYIKVKVRLI